MPLELRLYINGQEPSLLFVKSGNWTSIIVSLIYSSAKFVRFMLDYRVELAAIMLVPGAHSVIDKSILIDAKLSAKFAASA